METKQYWWRNHGVVHGPFSAKEMRDFNLPKDTEVTDELSESEWKTWWRTAADFDFREHCSSTRGSGTQLKLEGSVYQFYFKKSSQQYGPRTASQMLKLNLQQDTPVTESSLHGEWYVAGNFDFLALSEQENQVKSRRKQLAEKNAVKGAIWLIAGVLVTYLSVKYGFFGGVVAVGAIFWGFIQMMAGIFGDDGLTKEERSRLYEFEDDDKDDEPLDPTGEDLYTEYAKLGLTPDASDAEVRKAYHELAKRYHPDRLGSLCDEERQNAAARFHNVNEAYEKIKEIRKMK